MRSRISMPYPALLIAALGLSTGLRCKETSPWLSPWSSHQKPVAQTQAGLTADKEQEQPELIDSTEAIAASDASEPLTLVHAFPEGLALSVFPATVPQTFPEALPPVSGARRLTPEETEELTELDPTPPAPASPAQPKTMSDKILMAQERLLGVGPCFDQSLFNQEVFDSIPECYTPETDLDFDVGYRLKAGSSIPTPQRRPRPHSAQGEACLPAYARAKLARTVAAVDRATGLAVAMICQATLADQDELPPQGAFIDLKDTLQSAVAQLEGIRVEEARISRKDDRNERAIFLTEITVEYALSQTQTQRDEVRILHAPSGDGNLIYSGRLWFRSGIHDATILDPDKQAPMHYLSIDYQRIGTDMTPRIQYRLVQAQFVQNTLSAEPFDIFGDVSPFDERGQLKLSSGSPSINQPTSEQAVVDQTSALPDGEEAPATPELITVDFDPLTNTGQLAYWQNATSRYDEPASGMIFQLELDSNRQLNGCAVTGVAAANGPESGISIRKALSEGLSLLVPSGYYHPGAPKPGLHGYDDPASQPPLDTDKTCGDGLCQYGPYLYRQCFRQTATGPLLVDPTQMDGNSYQLLHRSAPEVSGALSTDFASLPRIEL